MSQTCRACRHPQRQAIDADLARGEPERAIASRYQLTRVGLQRHKKHQLAGAPEARRRALADRCLEYAAWHLENLKAIAEKTAVVPRDYLIAAREFTRALESFGGFRSGGKVEVQVLIKNELGVTVEEARRAVEAQRRVEVWDDDELARQAELFLAAYRRGDGVALEVHHEAGNDPCADDLPHASPSGQRE